MLDGRRERWKLRERKIGVEQETGKVRRVRVKEREKARHQC